MNASDFLVFQLHEWGVRTVFGYPGDGINGIMEALNRHREKVTFVQTRHEELAAFMARAHAKFTGDIGVCMATSGPGAIHLLNGLYDAKLGSQPVLAIVGQRSTVSLGADFQQEADLISLYKDIAGEYVHMANSPAQIRHLIDRSIRTAKADRTVTCVIVPNNVQEMEAVESPPSRHGSSYTGVGYVREKVIPAESELHKAATILNAGKRVAMLVGAGALGASQQVKEAAELPGTGVAKALLGKAVLSGDLPYVVGPIGRLGTKPSWDPMMKCFLPDSFQVLGPVVRVVVSPPVVPRPPLLPEEAAAQIIAATMTKTKTHQTHHHPPRPSRAAGSVAALANSKQGTTIDTRNALTASNLILPSK